MSQLGSAIICLAIDVTWVPPGKGIKVQTALAYCAASLWMLDMLTYITREDAFLCYSAIRTSVVPCSIITIMQAILVITFEVRPHLRSQRCTH